MPTNTRSCGALVLSVTACSANGVTPLVLTCSTMPATVAADQWVEIAGVASNNGAKQISIVDYQAKTLTFSGVAGSGTYGGAGGTVGRNYTNFSTWEAATDIDLAATSTIEELELHEDATGTFDLPTPPTPHAFDLSGATTSATGHRRVRAWHSAPRLIMDVVDVTPADGFPVQIEVDVLPPSVEVGDKVFVSGIATSITGYDSRGEYTIQEIDFANRLLTVDMSLAGTYTSGGTVRLERLDLSTSHRWDSLRRTGVRLASAIDNSTISVLNLSESHSVVEGFGVAMLSVSGSSTSARQCVRVFGGLGVKVNALSIDARIGDSEATGHRYLFGLNQVSFGATPPTLANPLRIHNTIVFGSDEAGVGASTGFVGNSSHVRRVHCETYGIAGGDDTDIISSGVGFLLFDVTERHINCAAFASRTADFARTIGFSPTSSLLQFRYNASSDQTAVDQNGSANGKGGLNVDSNLRNPLFGDLRTIIGSGLVDAGVNATVSESITTDIEGATRTGPHDIGPYNTPVVADNVTPFDVISSVGATGRDYATLSDWEVATDINVVARNIRHIAELYDDAVFGVGSGFVLGGATTDARRYRIVRPAEGHRYNPIDVEGVRIEGAVANVVEIAEQHSRFEGVRVDNTAGAAVANRVCVRVTADNVEVDAVIGVMETTAATGCRVFYATCDGLVLSNCIAAGNSNTEGAQFGFVVNGEGNYVLNCDGARIRYSAGATAFTDKDAGGTPVPGTHFINCIAVSSDVGFDVSDGYQESNASFDATASGVGSLINVAAASVFVDAAAMDFRLLGGSPAINTGRNLSDFFTTDFAGDPRVGVWEMGAYGGFIVPPSWQPNPIANVGQQSGTGHLTVCRIVERRDGVTLNVSDDTQALVFRGIVFTPAGSFGSSTRRHEISMRESNVECMGALSSDLITEEDLHARLYDGATVYEFWIDGKHPWTTPYWSTAYEVEKITSDGREWRAQLVGRSNRIEQRAGGIFSKTCSARLGDGECKIALTLYTHFGCVVDSVVSDRLVFDVDTSTLGTTSPLGQPLEDDWFKFGLVRFRSGANAGLQFEVGAYVQATRRVSLFVKTPFDIQPGDEFDLIAGCDKLPPTCNYKFDNILNIRAYPYIPGTDEALRTPRR